MQKFIKALVIICSLGMVISCNPKFYEYDTSENQSETGKCYAKCYIRNSRIVYDNPIFVYTGFNFENEYLKLHRLTITEASTKWEKRKSEKNCLSADPEDCMILFLVEIPATYSEYYEVLDTNAIKDFIIEEYDDIYKSGSYKELKEVICDSDITRELYSEVQIALIEKGYNPGQPDGIADTESKNALAKYQREHNLPIGQLDFETLKSFGIR